MAVCAEGGLDVLMAQALAHKQDRAAQVNEERGVGVPEIVEPDALHPGGLRGLQHLPPEVVLCEREQSVVRADVVERCHVLPQLCRQL